jgi:hypothetical protein
MAKLKLDIEFNTIEFVKSHGCAPRGRGSWAFSSERNGPIENVLFSPSMTYAEAKKWARAEIEQRVAGEVDYLTVYVQP